MFSCGVLPILEYFARKIRLITYKASKTPLYSAEVMRRAIALLLMLVFSSMLIAPLFAADPEAGLPPCCRSHGKHHCMMQRMQKPQPDGRPAFAAVREKCPCFPAGTVTSHSGQFALSAGSSFGAASIAKHFIPSPTDAGFRPAKLDSRPERGPPPSLA
jgi:hypothetical protein